MINTRLSMQLPFTLSHYTAGAGWHLPQAGQAVEDALRHARELVTVQIKAPVGMPDMSGRIQPVALSMPSVTP